MPTIIDGTAGITFPNSTVQASAGQVLQVVQTQYGTQVGSSSTTFSDTGLTASITPRFATSKILVLATVNGLEKTTGNNNNAVGLKLVRNSTDISNFIVFASWTNSSTSLITPSGVVNYLDSPATTSSTTYKVQFRNEQAASSVFVQSSGNISFMVLMEIAA